MKTQIGLGAYRISNRSNEHRDALTLALQSGCAVVDTSSNYTDGESEKLIGEVIKETGIRPFLISKAGYVQGQNLEVMQKLNDKGLATDDLVELSPELKHSIHPDFIRDQIERSLQRLQVESLDTYLLHNPEYYLKTEDSSKEEYYKRIEKAFTTLEELVKEGKIKSYGISSNTFVDPKEDHTSTDLVKVYELAKNISSTHHFKYIQFPLNLVELGALERQYEGLNLLEKAQDLGLKTIINRPLNAFTSQGLLRLANYPVDSKLNDSYATEMFDQLIAPLKEKWNEQKETHDEDLFEVSLMRQIQDMWYKQNSADAVEEIFYRYFFPFIAQVWGKNLTPQESAPFYDLFELALEFSRKNMNDRAEAYKKQATDAGMFMGIDNTDRDLDILAMEKYLTMGVDMILVGMRKVSYVEKFKRYF